MKIKIYFSVLLLIVLIFSCKKDDDVEPFDHEAQEVIDDASIREYLETHFYTPPATNEAFGVVDTILNGEEPLMNVVTEQIVDINDINYKLYYLKNTPEGTGSSASRVDSVFVKYQGLLMDYNFDEPKFDERINYTWFLLTSVIPGWSYGFPNYKAGVNISLPDMPITFENTGKGMLFIPSGLAYRNLGTSGIGPNKTLMFHIDLAQAEKADHDFDSVATIYEDLNNDDDYSNDDTDGNGVANFLDSDDDGDRLFTVFENADPNNDENPNDAIDTDGDGKPNFLDDDDDGDGVLTINENADPNRDGNPDDAEDSDGDNIPDYLDADTN